MNKSKLTKLRILTLTVIITISAAFVQLPVPKDSGKNAQSVGITVQAATKKQKSFSIKQVPKYKGKASVQVNGNKPYFTQREKEKTNTFESYHKLDKLGRCGVCYANVSRETMPTQERGDIGMVKPSGWHTVKYNGVVDGNYLYNRCHLIAYCLTAENANKKNLITGTRYMNTEGMLPYEEKTARYVDRTGNHVLYRVTPIFEGNNLVASGVLMEAYSVEDKGKGLSFCVYCYNVQPGVTIDYKTGDSHLSGKSDKNQNKDSSGKKDSSSKQNTSESSNQTYILNTNTKKFHKPECYSVKRMSEKNKKKYKGTKKQLIDEGYSPCKNCNP